MKEKIDLEQLGQEITQLISAIQELPDENVSQETIALINNKLQENIQNAATSDNIRKLYNDFRSQGYTQKEITKQKKLLSDSVESMIKELEFSNPFKEDMVRVVFEKITTIYDKIIAMYDNFYETVYFEKVKEGAKLPTYAHPDDACCDVYAPEDIEVPANAFGFKVDTGLKPVIPDGFEIVVRPRSGMSMKSRMRISNAPGTIDSGYTANICILFDNFSSKPYQIKAGDRIAQFAFQPVYRFEAKLIDNATAAKKSTRGEKGFGSTGK